MAVFGISANDWDAYSFVNAEFVSEADAPYSGFYLGYDAGAHDGGWHFLSTGIPQGATILTATMFVRNGADNGGAITGAWWGYLVTTLNVFSGSDLTHRVSDHQARTVATVADSSWTNGANHTSPSLVSIVQEIVNQVGFAGHIGLTWRNSGAASGNYWEWRDYSGGPTLSAELTVTWSSGVTRTPTGVILPVRRRLVRPSRRL